MIPSIFSKITNPSGSLAGILLLIAGFMEKAMGCVASATNPLDATCSAPWLVSILPPQYLVYAAMFFAALTLVGKFIRPGSVSKSLFGPTAVVVPPSQSGPGVVTSNQVRSP